MASVSKVHILGAGSIGSIIAFDMKHEFPPLLRPIMLLRPDSTIKPSTNHQIKLSRTINDQISTKFVEVESQKPNDVTGIIENLIVATKTYQTETAIEPYIKHITSSTNILFLQNGMGIANTLKNRYWTEPQFRPKIFEAITTHGAYKQEGVVHHVATGQIAISSSQEPEQIPDMIQQLLEIKPLNAKYYEYNEFLLMQIEKLLVNCCINALTSLFDCKNGELFYGEDTLYIWRSSINEALLVLIKEYPVLEKNAQFLNTDRLVEKVIDVANLTKRNSSSMRQDVRNLRQTEIENINGYISFLGRQHEFRTPVNSLLTNLIKSKLSIDRGIDQAAAESLLQS